MSKTDPVNNEAMVFTFHQAVLHQILTQQIITIINKPSYDLMLQWNRETYPAPAPQNPNHRAAARQPRGGGIKQQQWERARIGAGGTGPDRSGRGSGRVPAGNWRAAPQIGRSAAAEARSPAASSREPPRAAPGALSPGIGGGLAPHAPASRSRVVALARSLSPGFVG